MDTGTFSLKKLGEVLDLKNGKSIKPGGVGEYPVFGSNGIIGGCHEHTEHSGIVIGRVGAYCGSVTFCPGKFWASDNTIVAHPKNKDYDVIFLAYLLKKLDLNRWAGGAAQPLLTQTVLKQIETAFPSLTIQCKIAAILSAYDDLIENNLRRIKILEEMAQALYREWFVHFRFPGHEKVRLVDSPLGKIPEGWEVSTLGDNITALESGKRPKGGVANISEGIPSIGAENIDGMGKHDFLSEKYVPESFFRSMKKGVVADGDVALYKDGAYIGRSTYYRDGFPYRECCVNEHVFLIRTDKQKITPNMLYLWFRQPETIGLIRSKNANAAQPGINQKDVKDLGITVPDMNIVQMFDSLADPILGEIILLAKKNNVLMHIRDLLLPKLITGEVDVSDLEIALPRGLKHESH